MLFKCVVGLDNDKGNFCIKEIMYCLLIDVFKMIEDFDII